MTGGEGPLAAGRCFAGKGHNICALKENGPESKQAE